MRTSFLGFLTSSFFEPGSERGEIIPDFSSCAHYANHGKKKSIRVFQRWVSRIPSSSFSSFLQEMIMSSSSSLFLNLWCWEGVSQSFGNCCYPSGWDLIFFVCPLRVCIIGDGRKRGRAWRTRKRAWKTRRRRRRSSSSSNRSSMAVELHLSKM